MALEYFSEPESTGEGSLLFLNEWLEENPKNKETTFPILEFKAVKSGKGFLAVTSKFQIFIWKNSKLAKHLIQAMDVWINIEPDSGFLLAVVLDKKAKENYRLAVDKEVKVTWFQAGKGYTTFKEAAHLEESDLNPFL